MTSIICQFLDIRSHNQLSNEQNGEYPNKHGAYPSKHSAYPSKPVVCANLP